MSNEKEKILNYFQFALDQGIKDALLGSNSKEEQNIHSVPRMLYIMDGSQEIEYFSSEGLKKITRGAGSAQYCGKNGYMYSRPLIPTKVISISYYGEFIRCMYIDYNVKDLPPTSRDVFYHTNAPLSKLGQNLLKILDDLAETKSYQSAEASLLEALLQISIEDIRSNDENKMLFHSSSYKLWRALDSYLRSHFRESLSRANIAEAFNISTSHVSHLFKKFGGKDLTSTLTNYRLKHAEMLLTQTRLSLDEIAEQCNYNYTSYFIRIFKKKHKMTPNTFRCRSKKIITANSLALPPIHDVTA